MVLVCVGMFMWFGVSGSGRVVCGYVCEFVYEGHCVHMEWL